MKLSRQQRKKKDITHYLPLGAIGDLVNVVIDADAERQRVTEYNWTMRLHGVKWERESKARKQIIQEPDTRLVVPDTRIVVPDFSMVER